MRRARDYPAWIAEVRKQFPMEEVFRGLTLDTSIDIKEGSYYCRWNKSALSRGGEPSVLFVEITAGKEDDERYDIRCGILYKTQGYRGGILMSETSGRIYHRNQLLGYIIPAITQANEKFFMMEESK